MHTVFKWILSGAMEPDILEAIEATWPGESPKPLIAAAIERFCKAGEMEPAAVIGWCFEAYRDLYRRMVEIGDFAGALRAIKLITELTKV